MRMANVLEGYRLFPFILSTFVVLLLLHQLYFGYEGETCSIVLLIVMVFILMILTKSEKKSFLVFVRISSSE